MRRRTEAERGVALLGVLVALAALTLVATALATSALRSERRAHAALRGLQADALVRSGVTVAATLLADHAATGAPDTLRAAWATPLGRQPLGAGWVEATVEDEGRRLDLADAAGLAALPALLREVGLDPGLADAIADWADADDRPRPHGAERAWYLGLRPPLVPANAPPTSVAELGLVRGVDAATLARLRPFVTTVGDGRVNPNTAPPEVLAAWLGDPARVRAVVDARRDAVVACDDLPACTTRSAHYTVRVAAGVADVRRGAEAVVWVLGSRPAVTAWRPLER